MIENILFTLSWFTVWLMSCFFVLAMAMFLQLLLLLLLLVVVQVTR